MLKIYQRAVCKSQAVHLSVVQASDSLACQLEHLVETGQGRAPVAAVSGARRLLRRR